MNSVVAQIIDERHLCAPLGMSNILFSSEFGSGLGHVGPLRAIAIEFVRRGHRVAIATNNMALCQQAFAGSGVTTLPAPMLPISRRRLKFPCTYSDILHDCGYSSADNVTVVVGEWLKLFDWVRPDLLLADHSPTALLASRARSFATSNMGTGFVCPPDITPLPSLRKEIPEPHWAVEVEQTVLNTMNTALMSHACEPLSRVTQIYAKTPMSELERVVSESRP